MKLEVVTANLPENQSFKALILSLLKKAFSKKKTIKSVHVVLSQSEDKRVPYIVEMNLKEENEDLLKSSAVSANYLTAFSQALNRMERQLEKRRA